MRCVVALDPRGVGSSTPIQCDVELWNQERNLFPTTEADFDSLVEQNVAIGNSCLNDTGNLLFHMDTMSVAKDFEAVRVALGGDKFNFLGLSYGSQIGYTYAQLFPNNIGGIVGDAVLNHAQANTDVLATETQAYEDQFDRFVQWYVW
jgi:pimeloyl-ACP methyl ester carboxylesterase